MSENNFQLNGWSETLLKEKGVDITSNKEKLEKFVMKTAEFSYKVLRDEYSRVREFYKLGAINDYELFVEVTFFSEDEKDIIYYSDSPIGSHELELIEDCDYVLKRSFDEACVFEDFYERMNHMISSCLDTRLLPDEKIPVPAFCLLKVTSYYQLFDELKGKIGSIRDIEELIAKREYQLLQVRNKLMKMLLSKSLSKEQNSAGFRIFINASLVYEIGGEEFSIHRERDAKYLSYYMCRSPLQEENRFKRFSNLARLVLIDIKELMDIAPGFSVENIRSSLVTLSVEREFVIFS